MRTTIRPTSRWTLPVAALALTASCAPMPDDDLGAAHQHAVGDTGDVRVARVTPAVPLNAGDSTTVTFDVENAGATAVDVGLSDVLPPALRAAAYYCYGGVGVTCVESGASLAALGPIHLEAGVHTSIAVELRLGTAARPPSVRYEARVAPVDGTVDPMPDNNVAAVEFPVGVLADLSARLSGPTAARSGDVVTYALVFANAGPGDALAEVRDGFPADAFSATTWTCAPSEGSGAACDGVTGATTTSGAGLFDTQARIPAGSSVTYTVTARVASGFTGATTVGAEALVVPETDPAESYAEANAADNLASQGLTVTAAPPPPPPVFTCADARPSVSTLWPPDGRMIPVRIEGLGAATTRVTGVRVDEGAGRNSDAVIDRAGAARVRAERNGTGDGRVYHLAFEATRDGARCTGTVRVCVPHHPGQACVDGGPRYDATRSVCSER